MANDEKHWVDSKHYRVVSDDGSKSHLYESRAADIVPTRDKCIEISDHRKDGTTQAYEANGSLLWGDGRGKKK